MAHNVKSYPSTRRPPNVVIRGSESPTKRPRRAGSSSEEVIDWPASDEDQSLLGKKASSSTIQQQEADLWDLVDGRTSPPAKKLKRGGSAAAFSFGNTTPQKDHTTPRKDDARPVTPPPTVQRPAAAPQTPVTPSTSAAGAAGPDPLSLLEALSAAVTPLKASLERHDRLLKAAQKARDAKDKVARDRLMEIEGLKTEIDRLQAKVRVLEAERQ